jgi:hypothetical protein
MFKQFFLPLIMLCAFSLTLAAQGTTEEEARDDLDYYNTENDRVQDQRGDTFGENLWFGTGAQLGFQGGNNTSFFQIGLSPIVGYKLNNFLSVGPRGSFAYNSYKEDFGNGEFKASFVTWSAGAFARAKIVYPFFAHVEYSLLNEVQNFDANGDAVRSTRTIPFLGGGISQGGGQGGGAGYEILILFRLSQADRIGDAPFELRTGLNFNF